ncbi:DUF4864 domain-containing protein [Acuticoccus yangtzensis]|uniref:DUF4864 domain-containing protein n=1 Tax=Acuticoccus yangtzensis TaxID=1443441 RepID=UPI0009495BA7|nr:DUF4864 domain-containing protein [Acuticoccus yangtzensis]ORE95525.1 hypothetical protein ATO13_01665 [Stappia sp. 22II-S9-Z10]
MKRILSLVVVAFVGLSAEAHANPDAIQSTIKAQMKALKAGDAEAAYAYAAPAIKRMFPTPERYITMVRKGYKAVTRAGHPTFLRSRTNNDGTYAQEVAFRDQAGESWRALYTLALQPDGHWRITGCYLKKVEGSDA